MSNSLELHPSLLSDPQPMAQSLISARQAARLTHFCRLLIDQESARVIVEPQDAASGFWFGGGNMCQGPDGALYVCGRYRNAGDSRTGVAAGTRGLELAIFRSNDRGVTFEKVVSWSKSDLNPSDGTEVLSIEGSCLRFTHGGVELFVSTEKLGRAYPGGLEDYLKPGAGVWTIDVLRADTMENLLNEVPRPAVQSDEPGHLHIKDPFYWETDEGVRLGYCSHPFGWSSSNTGVTDIPDAGTLSANLQNEAFSRGPMWDVAMTRGTSILPVPRVGPFEDGTLKLLFYCGGECLRLLDEHSTAVRRPRGYSCEELGGAAVIVGDDPSTARRLSSEFPLFISPWGTGCSRYVDVLATDDGFYATWQQSQEDLSQPLVMNFLSREEAEACLAAE